MAAKRPTPGHTRSSPRWLSLSPRRVLTRGTSGAQADTDNPAAKNTIRVAHAGPEERAAGELEESRISVTPSVMLDRQAFATLSLSPAPTLGRQGPSQGLEGRFPQALRL